MLGQNIKKLRILNDMTLKDLSNKTGVGISTLSEIESGKIANPRTSTINKIADALDVNLNELLGFDKQFNQTLSTLEDEEILQLTRDIFKLDKENRDIIITMIQQMISKYKKS